MQQSRNEEKKPSKIKKYIIPMLCTVFTAAQGLLFANTSSAWYTSLVKPFFWPGEGVIGLVCLLVLSAAALSATLVSESEGARPGKLASYTAYAVSGALCCLWPYIFFELKNPLSAFFELLLLLVAAFALFCQARLVNRRASYLVLPFFIWLVFMAMLNYCIVMLN